MYLKHKDENFKPVLDFQLGSPGILTSLPKNYPGIYGTRRTLQGVKFVELILVRYQLLKPVTKIYQGY